jgi:hypothetical protein
MSAMTIMQELGGTHFQTATQARDFSYPQNGLAFRLARPASGIDRVQIMPEADRYTMTFFRGDTQIVSVSGIGGDRLLETFESYTNQAM